MMTYLGLLLFLFLNKFGRIKAIDENIDFFKSDPSKMGSQWVYVPDKAGQSIYIPAKAGQESKGKLPSIPPVEGHWLHYPPLAGHWIYAPRRLAPRINVCPVPLAPIRPRTSFRKRFQHSNITAKPVEITHPEMKYFLVPTQSWVDSRRDLMFKKKIPSPTKRTIHGRRLRRPRRYQTSSIKDATTEANQFGSILTTSETIADLTTPDIELLDITYTEEKYDANVTPLFEADDFLFAAGQIDLTTAEVEIELSTIEEKYDSTSEEEKYDVTTPTIESSNLELTAGARFDSTTPISQSDDSMLEAGTRLAPTSTSQIHSGNDLDLESSEEIYTDSQENEFNFTTLEMVSDLTTPDAETEMTLTEEESDITSQEEESDMTTPELNFDGYTLRNEFEFQEIPEVNLFLEKILKDDSKTTPITTTVKPKVWPKLDEARDQIIWNALCKDNSVLKAFKWLFKHRCQNVGANWKKVLVVN